MTKEREEEISRDCAKYAIETDGAVISQDGGIFCVSLALHNIVQVYNRREEMYRLLCSQVCKSRALLSHEAEKMT